MAEGDEETDPVDKAPPVMEEKEKEKEKKRRGIALSQTLGTALIPALRRSESLPIRDPSGSDVHVCLPPSRFSKGSNLSWQSRLSAARLSSAYHLSGRQKPI